MLSSANDANNDLFTMADLGLEALVTDEVLATTNTVRCVPVRVANA